MPDCACGETYGKHIAIWVNVAADVGTMNPAVPMFLCPGPAAQAAAVGGVPIPATFYSPTTALTAEQFAYEQQ